MKELLSTFPRIATEMEATSLTRKEWIHTSLKRSPMYPPSSTIYQLSQISRTIPHPPLRTNTTILIVVDNAPDYVMAERKLPIIHAFSRRINAGKLVALPLPQTSLPTPKMSNKAIHTLESQQNGGAVLWDDPCDGSAGQETQSNPFGVITNGLVFEDFISCGEIRFPWYSSYFVCWN